ncbi:MAG: exo-alpha-sialidase [Saprospiraceae bacterium]
MHIHILAFLLFFQPFTSCQRGQEKTQPLEASAAFQSAGADWLNLEKSLAPATNIIFQSTDGGQTWLDISAGLPGDKPVDYFLARNGEAFLGTANGLYHSPIISAAPVWEKEFLLNEQFTGVFPGRAGLYARSFRNGFFQKTGGSGIWMPVFADLKNQHFRTIFETPNGTLFIGTDSGIFKSTDHGKTWKHVFEDGWVISMVESGGVLICTNEQGILRSADGGEHWDVVLSEGGVGIAVEVIEGGFAAITYNTESKTRRVRISEDGGKTWQPIDAELPPASSIASIKQVGKYFFCGHPDGIFRSADRGKTWKLILPSVVEKVFNLSVSGNVIYAVPRNGGC